MRAHWSAFDPSRVHPRADELPGWTDLDVRQIVRRDEELDGQLIGVIVHIQAEQRWQSPYLGTRILQLVSAHDQRATVYCRGTVAQDYEFDREKMLFAANGAVIATGIIGTYDGGSRQAAYVLASFVGEFPQTTRP